MSIQKNKPVLILIGLMLTIILVYITYVITIIVKLKIPEANPLSTDFKPASLLNVLKPSTMSLLDNIKLTIKKALTIYVTPVVQNAEKMFRLESGNFTSGQFLRDYGAGMEGFSDSYPYAWTSLKPFWDANPDYMPTGLDLKGAPTNSKGFIKFPSFEAAFMTLCYWLDNHNNDTLKWNPIYLTDEPHYYNIRVNNQKSTICDEIAAN